MKCSFWLFRKRKHEHYDRAYPLGYRGMDFIYFKFWPEYKDNRWQISIHGGFYRLLRRLLLPEIHIGYHIIEGKFDKTGQLLRCSDHLEKEQAKGNLTERRGYYFSFWLDVMGNQLRLSRIYERTQNECLYY